jgi:hypothetical protein
MIWIVPRALNYVVVGVVDVEGSVASATISTLKIIAGKDLKALLLPSWVFKKF